MDSVGLLHLLLFLEEQFQITVADEEVVPENFGTIRSLASFIQSKKTVPS